jgi:hypothetical protein
MHAPTAPDRTRGNGRRDQMIAPTVRVEAASYQRRRSRPLLSQIWLSSTPTRSGCVASKLPEIDLPGTLLPTSESAEFVPLGSPLRPLATSP